MGTCTGSKDCFWGVMVEFAIALSCSECGMAASSSEIKTWSF